MQPVIDHVPAAFAKMFTSKGVTEPPPSTCTQPVEFDTIWLFGFLKLHVTRANLAASEGFLTPEVSTAIVLSGVFDGVENDANERLMPRMTLNVLLALMECCRVAEAQLAEALMLHVVTFHLPVIPVNTLAV